MKRPRPRAADYHLKKHAARTDPDDMGTRVRILRIAMEYDEQQAFAAFLGITPGRWTNVETQGYSLSIKVAHMLVEKTGVTLDWLFYGDEGGLTRHKIDWLHAATIRALAKST